MSASDIILARKALRTAITHLRDAQTSAGGARNYVLRDAMERRAESLELLVSLLTDDLNERAREEVRT